MSNIKEIFENKIKIDSKVVSIESLFNNEDRLKNTNYKPSYQRNYVWDDEKATYFIESILLGTEIPPLIYFRNISKVEIIDGRQRYETILRFLENEFKLKKSGLKKLDSKEFINKNYENLDLKYRELIFGTKLRIIEFSFNTSEGLNENSEDDVKKEIFKRYNTGITPLKNTEIEKAEYLFDDVNTFLKDQILKDKLLYDTLKTLFYFEKSDDEIILKKIRELLIIENIPIKYFANKKGTIINSYYEYAFSDTDSINFELLKNTFIRKINIIRIIYDIISQKISYNRLISECLFWALSVTDREKTLDCMNDENINTIAKYIVNNASFYEWDRSSFARNINTRYTNVSSIFEELFHIDFSKYLNRTEDFNRELLAIDNLHLDESPIIFDKIRLNKPEPSSSSIDDIVRAISRQKFLIRPQYQRKEVIDRKKRSSIIESILLGIKLPPLFIFKRKDGVSEVIDGQQRLLSILSFLGKDYLSDTYENLNSDFENFALNLKNGILTNLHGKKFKDLAPVYQEKIKNFDLWIIEIDQKYNEQFDPIDLFIRLNYKPYPIKLDSFEMWNSYLDRNLINTIKNIYNNHKDWLYLRKSTRRMENETIITSLIYLYFDYSLNFQSKNRYSALDYYKIGNKINFRLKSKNDVTKKLEFNSLDLIEYSNRFELDFIYKLKFLISFNKDKSLAQNLDYILSVENGRRTQQSLYALWFFLNEISESSIAISQTDIVQQTRNLFKKMNSVNNIVEFEQAVSIYRKIFSHSKYIGNDIFYFRLADIATLFRGIEKNKIHFTENNHNNYLLKSISFFSKNFETFKARGLNISNLDSDLVSNFKSGEKIIIHKNLTLFHPEMILTQEDVFFDADYYGITLKRPLVKSKYVYVMLASQIPLMTNEISSPNINLASLKNIPVPYIELRYQELFENIYDFVVNSENELMFAYFTKILNELTFGLYNHSLFATNNFSYFAFLDELINILEKNMCAEWFNILSDKNSIVSSYLLLVSVFKNRE